jgi:hypothetical protein
MRAVPLVGDQARDALVNAQVADPAGQQTGLEEDYARPVPLDQPTQLDAAGSDR